MTAILSRAPQILRRATSRTRTARAPFATPSAAWVFGFEPASFEELYAGPPDVAPLNPKFPGHTAALPFADAAVQVYARADRQLSFVLLLIDLHANRDLARIELYGNPLLPPDDQGGRPVHNFGLPTTVGMAVREQPFQLPDLHRRQQRGTFYGDFAERLGHSLAGAGPARSLGLDAAASAANLRALPAICLRRLAAATSQERSRPPLGPRHPAAGSVSVP